jgi:hypothetical protein
MTTKVINAAGLKPAVSIMNRFDASDIDAAFVQCAVCEKAITGGKWFARMAYGPRMFALCCPLCTEVFERNPRPYVRRVETLEKCAA